MKQLKRPKTVYVCQKCGSACPRWVGRCPECGEWGTLVEEVATPQEQKTKPFLGGDKPIPITQVKNLTTARLVTGIQEFDRIMGGGIVVGSTILIGGDPGIGKSTIVLQISHKLTQSNLKVLYISAEESVYQSKLRAERLQIDSDNLLIASETNIEVISAYIEEYKPDFVIIDSIQMVYRTEIPTAPGTVTQVRESAMALVYLCKRKGISLMLIGHVTKEGALAGPRTLEHMVDTVLYFEGDRFQSFRILRAVKNRFGSTNEIGIFEMKNEGLEEVANPSELFIAQADRKATGTVIVPALIGTRPLLIEIQALTSRSYYATPSRRVSGIDFNRMAMILAVLERRLGVPLGSQDVFVNAVGGVKVDEPAADLAVAIAVLSSYKNKPVQDGTLLLGEIGLSGEIRPVNHINNRLQESARLGFKKIVIPADNNKRLLKPEGITIISSSSLQNVVEMML
ncbi:MAG: DNA repair protein RadA [Planctomycetes bacterium]|nr:DNA repair protein RadA [Planctomycetota bacterium]